MRVIKAMEDKYLQPSLELVEKVFTDSECAENGKLVRSLVEEIRSKRFYLPELELIMVDSETDEVIGRDGGLNIRNGEFIVFASADIIFRTNVDELDAWELLSKDGVVLIGPDLEHGGEERTIIAYYVYYRK